MEEQTYLSLIPPPSPIITDRQRREELTRRVRRFLGTGSNLANVFNRLAPRYSACYEHRTLSHKQVIDTIGPDYFRGRATLVLGAGDGRLVSEILALTGIFGIVVVIEIAERMAEVAIATIQREWRGPTSGIPYRMIVGDYKNYSDLESALTAASLWGFELFDNIIGYDVLRWIPAAARNHWVGSWVDMLQPLGRLFLTVEMEELSDNTSLEAPAGVVHEVVHSRTGRRFPHVYRVFAPDSQWHFPQLAAHSIAEGARVRLVRATDLHGADMRTHDFMPSDSPERQASIRVGMDVIARRLLFAGNRASRTRIMARFTRHLISEFKKAHRFGEFSILPVAVLAEFAPRPEGQFLVMEELHFPGGFEVMDFELVVPEPPVELLPLTATQTAETGPSMQDAGVGTSDSELAPPLEDGDALEDLESRFFALIQAEFPGVTPERIRAAVIEHGMQDLLRDLISITFNRRAEGDGTAARPASLYSPDSNHGLLYAFLAQFITVDEWLAVGEEEQVRE